MPKMAAELSAIEIKRLTHNGGKSNHVVAVGGVSGLMLQIAPGGGKSWVLRTVVGSKRREIGLGGFPDVPLTTARERAREAKEAIRQSIDPIEQRKATRASLVALQKRGLTFDQAIARYLDAKLGEFKSKKHLRQWSATLDTYASPTVGQMLVGDLQVADIARALSPIWTVKTVTAMRLRGRIESVLAWATVAGHRTGDNPARWKGNLDTLLPKPGKVARRDNHPALALDDVSVWFKALQQREGVSAKALQFLAMCAARSGEVRGAKWAEFDLDAGIWTIPAARMKMKREHRVPLTPDAVGLIRSMPQLSEYVFSAPRGGPLSDMSLSAVMRRMHADAIEQGTKGWLDPRNGRAAVPHGLRSCFRDWCAETTEYPREMAEIALAHHVGNEVERAYRRSDMVERRRALMTDWWQYILGKRYE